MIVDLLGGCRQRSLRSLNTVLRLYCCPVRNLSGAALSFKTIPTQNNVPVLCDKAVTGRKAAKLSTHHCMTHKNVNARRRSVGGGKKRGGRKIRLLFAPALPTTSSLFQPPLVFFPALPLISLAASLSFTLSYRARTPTAFLKHTLPHPQSPRPPHFSSPPSSPTLTRCVIQSSQGDGYPSPRSAYALHFLKRLIRLIDCPPTTAATALPPLRFFLPPLPAAGAAGARKSSLH